MIRALTGLYPRGWRARYGEEFEAFLETQRLTPMMVIDVVLGALDARLHGDRTISDAALPWRTPRGLVVALASLVVVDVALRVFWLAGYLPSTVYGFSITEPLDWFAWFPVVLFPLAVIGPRASGRGPTPVVLVAALLLAFSEVLRALSYATSWASPKDQLTFWWTLVQPLAGTAGASFMALGLAMLAFGLSRLWPRRRDARARRLGVGLLGVTLLVPAVLDVLHPGDPALTLDVVVFWNPSLTLPAAYLAWVCLTSVPHDARVARLAARGAVLVYVSFLLPQLFRLVPDGLGLLSGGNFRWDVLSLISGVGFLALGTALAAEHRLSIGDWMLPARRGPSIVDLEHERR